MWILFHYLISRFMRFLQVKKNVFHQIWGVFSHYFSNSLCSFHSILCSWNSIFVYVGMLDGLWVFVFLFKFILQRLDNLNWSIYYCFLILTREYVYWWEREKNMDVIEKHQISAYCMLPNQRSNPQTRYVPWPETEPTVFLLYSMRLQ